MNHEEAKPAKLREEISIRFRATRQLSILSHMYDLNTLMALPVRVSPQLVEILCVLVLILVVIRLLPRLLQLIPSPFRTTIPSLPPGLFEQRPYLLTDGEHAFLPALEQAIGNQYRIAMKVRLGDLVSVHAEGSSFYAAFNKINRKHVDFVLCTPYPVKPVLAIELDDASHDRPDRQARDGFVDACLDNAGLPIHHVPCQQAYDVGQLAADIKAKIGQAQIRRRPR